MDPTGKFAYITANGLVYAYMINAASGALTPVSGSPFGPDLSSEGLTINPTGKFVYVTNTNSSSISGYRINAATGALTPIASSPLSSLGLPASVTIDPTGTAPYVANEINNSYSTSYNVCAYTIDPATGALTLLAGSPFRRSRCRPSEHNHHCRTATGDAADCGFGDTEFKYLQHPDFHVQVFERERICVPQRGLRSDQRQPERTERMPRGLRAIDQLSLPRERCGKRSNRSVDARFCRDAVQCSVHRQRNGIVGKRGRQHADSGVVDYVQASIQRGEADLRLRSGQRRHGERLDAVGNVDAESGVEPAADGRFGNAEQRFRPGPDVDVQVFEP